MLLRFQQNLWYIYLFEDTLEHINLTVIDNYKCKKNHNVVGYMHQVGFFQTMLLRFFIVDMRWLHLNIIHMSTI